MLTFANGVFASIDCSWSKPNYYPTWGGLTFEMVTERGAVIVDAFKQNLTVYSHDVRRPLWAYWGSDMNQAMIDEFVAAIREEREPRVTGEDGQRAVEIVARRMSRRRQDSRCASITVEVIPISSISAVQTYSSGSLMITETVL